MESSILWKKFEKSGKIEDYLAYSDQLKREEKLSDGKDSGSDNQGALHG